MRALGLLLLAVTGCQRGASSADAGLDITTARPFTLDLPALRAERTLGDLLAINLKYQQLLGVRLLPYDETMCKGGDAALLAEVKRFGDTLARDPKKMLEQVKHELAAPALHHAALLCQPDVIRLLVRRGAKVEAVDGRGLTALHWSSCEAATEALVELHASVTAKSTTGLTPLHLAIDRGSVAVLLAHGAELEAPDACGNRPLHVASWFGLSFPAALDGGELPFVEPRWLQLVVKGAAEAKQALALLTERFDVVGELKRRGANANAQNAAGREPRVQSSVGWD